MTPASGGAAGAERPGSTRLPLSLETFARSQFLNEELARTTNNVHTFFRKMASDPMFATAIDMLLDKRFGSTVRPPTRPRQTKERA